jgi:hypothetical protein
MNIQDYKGKTLITRWTHNSGFKSNWLRRINRVSKTQLISDILRDTNFEKKTKELWKTHAHRFNIKDGNPVERRNHLANTDGVNTCDLFTSNDDIKCASTYAELFETDYRELFKDEPKVIERLNKTFEIMNKGCEIKENIESIEKYIYFPCVEISSEWYLKDCFPKIIKHLEDMFGLPVYGWDGDRINLTHNMSKLKSEGYCYHITKENEDKFSIPNTHTIDDNHTVMLWVFDDRIVFTTMDGIGTW